MTQDHPITPSLELVEIWYAEAEGPSQDVIAEVATQAARWGADQELEACCMLLNGAKIVPPDSTTTYPEDVIAARKRVAKLRAARRPKPPSLAQRALHILGMYGDLSPKEHSKLTHFLEALPDD